MSEQNKPQVTITHLSSKGRGMATLPPLRVEVLGGVPEDKLEVVIQKKRRGTALATIENIVYPSPFRVPPRCCHVPVCGGCSMQQIAYSYQLQEKEKAVRALFAPIAQEALFHPIMPSIPWAYRNKMEFSFSQNKAGERFLGLILARTRGHVFNLEECPISPSWFSTTRDAVYNFWVDAGLLAYKMNDEGSLRTLTIREAKRTGQKMVILTVSGNPNFALKRTQIDAFVQAVKDSLPHDDVSIFIRIQQIAKGTPTQFFEMHLSGPAHIEEILHISRGKEKKELIFSISPTSFFQPNTLQADLLYSRALQMADIGSDAHVLDLYCGTGTLGLAFGLRAKKVTGIEINPHAVFDAQKNAADNKLDNVEVLCGDVGKVLKGLKIAPDLIVVDPPRSGLDNAALEHIKALSAQKILYVSCNPKTQVENIKTLQEAGYQLIEVQPIDQFPHTVHVENIVLLKKRV